MDLLDKIIGTHRIDDAEQARTLVAQCGFLPLAIRIAGARLGNRRDWNLTYATWRMRRGERRLREPALADRSVAGEIRLSYRQLCPDQQRMLLSLGTAPADGFDSDTAASLAAVPLLQAEDLLEELVDACLLRPLPTPGHYHLHELVRGFAIAEAATSQAAHLPEPGPRTCTCA
jgi:hypothetical protein